MQIAMSLFAKILKRKPIPLIAVGTGIDTYRICENLQRKPMTFDVKFIINDEPWQHKTWLLGSECRYPSELLALIRNHQIKAVICPESEPLCKQITEYYAGIAEQQCALFWCGKSDSKIIIENKISDAIKICEDNIN